MKTPPLIMEENGKRYRLLQVGETLEKGDQVNIPWEDVLDSLIGGRIKKSQGCELPYGYYRRPMVEDAK